MLIFVFLTPFFIAIACIIYLGNSNEKEIKTFFENNSCEYIYNYKTRYKALCNEKIILINDHFIIDFSSNIEIKYKDIIKYKKDNLNLILSTESGPKTLAFKENSDLKFFFEALEEKLYIK